MEGIWTVAVAIQMRARSAREVKEGGRSAERGALEEEGDGGGEFEEHDGADDPAGAGGVGVLVGDERVGRDAVEEGVMDDLHETDEAGHEEGGG